MDILTRTEISELAKEAPLIGFGAGELAEQTIRFLNTEFAYFVDNATRKQGTKLAQSIDIFSPEKLREAPGNSIVLLCTEQYESVEEQIRSTNPELRCYLSPLLKDYPVFSSLLYCSERLLVTAYGVNGGIYLVNARTREYQCLTVGAYRGCVSIDSMLHVMREDGSIFRIDSLEPYAHTCVYQPDDFTHGHGLAYWKEEQQLFVADTRFDRISVLDCREAPFKKIDDFLLSDIVSRDREDQHHVNDLLIEDNTLYASIISKQGLKKNRATDGAVLKKSLPDGSFEIARDDYLFPHSVARVGEELLALESLSGRITTFSGTVLGQLPGYLRGLAVSDDILYLGQSRNRLYEVSKEHLGAISMDSGIWVFSLSSQVTRFVHLPDLCDVYAIVDLST